MSWTVWQTGGRRHRYWCLVFAGSETEARARYDLLKVKAEERDRQVVQGRASARAGIQLRDAGVPVATYQGQGAKVI